MKFKLLCAGIAALGIYGAAPANADTIPFLPTWNAYDQVVGLGNFFPETFTATATGTVLVTDLYVPGDGYEIFDNANPVAIALAADCTADGPGGCTVGGPVYAYTAAQGWASSLFAHAAFGVLAGDVITIEVLEIPTGYSDSTVAITEAVPEPGTLALFGVALLALGGLSLRRKST